MPMLLIVALPSLRKHRRQGCQDAQCCTDCWALLQGTRVRESIPVPVLEVAPPSLLFVSHTYSNEAVIVGKSTIKEGFTLFTQANNVHERLGRPIANLTTTTASSSSSLSYSSSRPSSSPTMTTAMSNRVHDGDPSAHNTPTPICAQFPLSLIWIGWGKEGHQRALHMEL